MYRLILAILFSAVAAGAFAQSKIDNLIDRYEKKNDVETTYTERRTPKKQLWKVSKILTFRDQGYYNNLMKAFEDERENSVSAVKTATQITYTFANKKGVSTYTLTREAPYTLVMTWRSSKANDDDAFNDPATGCSTTMMINGEVVACYDDQNDFGNCDESWQSLGREIMDLTMEMDELDLSNQRDCRRYVALERKRAKLQKRLAKLNSQHAGTAYAQAEMARRQAEMAQRQAEMAQRQAEMAQRQARFASTSTTSGNGNSTTTIYYNY